MNHFYPCLAGFLLIACTSASGGDRVALVIGIDRYDHLPAEAQLSVAVSDAGLIADTLKNLNPPFSVQLLKDVSQREAMESLTNFVDEAHDAECALVYFAGHGVEYHGSNFLLARDTRVTNVSPDIERTKRRLSLSALPLQAIVDEMDGTKARVKVVVLDACRNNPLKTVQSSAGRNEFGKTRGLAQVSPPTGTLIAFSADAGQQANDGLFTRILSANLKKTGIPLPHVFALTREQVRAEAIALEKGRKGVFHEPAEYTKLNLAGMKFSFSQKLEKLEDSKIGNVVAQTKLHRITDSLLQEYKLEKVPDYYILYYTASW